MKINDFVLVNRDFAESCWSLGIEALDTDTDAYQVRGSDFRQLRLEGRLRHLHPSDWQPD